MTNRRDGVRRWLRRVLLTPLLVVAMIVILLPRLSAYLLEMVSADQGRTRSVPGGAPFAARGPHAVGLRRTTLGEEPLDVWMWYPASAPEPAAAATTYPFGLRVLEADDAIAIATSRGRAAIDAPPDLTDGPYPLVVLSPGFAIGSRSYGWLAEHLASHGFVVASPEHREVLDPASFWRGAVTRPRDVSLVLASIRERSAETGDLHGLVDPERLAVVGHSLGGQTALMSGGARLDTDAFRDRCAGLAVGDPGTWLCDTLEPRIDDIAHLAGLDAVPHGLWPAVGPGDADAVVSLAGDAFLFGPAGLEQVEVPVLAIGGTADEDSPFAWGTGPTFAETAGPRKMQIALEGAGHMVFTGPCEDRRRLLQLIPSGFCEDEGWDRWMAHDVVRHYVTAFLRAELLEDRAASTALTLADATFPRVDRESLGYGAATPLLLPS